MFLIDAREETREAEKEMEVHGERCYDQTRDSLGTSSDDRKVIEIWRECKLLQILLCNIIINESRKKTYVATTVNQGSVFLAHEGLMSCCEGAGCVQNDREL